MSKIILKKNSFVALLASLSIAATQAVTAPATEVSDNIDKVAVSEYGNQEITPEILEQAFEELKNSDIPRTVNDDSTVTFIIDGMELTLRDPHAITPYVNGGLNGNTGFWVEFTPKEQDLLISGGGFALGTAICLLPAVGQVACIVIGAVITGAAWAISAYGKCESRLHVDFYWGGKVQDARCT